MPKIDIADGWVDLLKGLGSAVPSTTSYFAGSAPSTDSETYLDLFDGDWLARRIVTTYPDEALRKRASIEGVDAAEAERLWEAYDGVNISELYPQGLLQQALYQGRAAGGSVLLLGFRYGEPDKPAPSPGNRSEIAWLDVCPWTDLTVERRDEDANSPRYGRPELLRVSGDHPRRGLIFHASRSIPCEGLTRGKTRASDPTPWLSVLEPVYTVLQDYGLSWTAISRLLLEASTSVLKMQGLIQLLASKNQDAVRERMRLINEGRSAARTIFLDAEFEEDYSRTEVAFAGVPAVLEAFMLRVSGAANIPVTRLFGRTPSGLNSTGEHDTVSYYDTAAYYQRIAVAPKQSRLLSLIAGRQVKLVYPPMVELTDLEFAEIRRINADSDTKYFELGVLDSQEILDSRSADGSLGVEVEVGKETDFGAAEEATEEAAEETPT